MVGTCAHVLRATGARLMHVCFATWLLAPAAVPGQTLFECRGCGHDGNSSQYPTGSSGGGASANADRETSFAHSCSACFGATGCGRCAVARLTRTGIEIVSRDYSFEEDLHRSGLHRSGLQRSDVQAPAEKGACDCRRRGDRTYRARSALQAAEPSLGPLECTKLETSGWHQGDTIRVLDPKDAPDGAAWTWEQCAAACAGETGVAGSEPRGKRLTSCYLLIGCCALVVHHHVLTARARGVPWPDALPALRNLHVPRYKRHLFSRVVRVKVCVCRYGRASFGLTRWGFLLAPVAHRCVMDGPNRTPLGYWAL